jgi:hypothetical protein
MQSTKWWLGFLDYVGLGNWVGADLIPPLLLNQGSLQMYFLGGFQDYLEVHPKED